MKHPKRKLLNMAVCLSLLIITFSALPANANGVESVDMSTWTAESYPAVSGFPAGLWTVSGDKTSVYQSNNGQPTFFYSDFNAVNNQMQGTIKVTSGQWDDDYIGFALGFQPGDSTNPSADYLLIDWKKNTQSYDFASPSCGPGSNAPAGLAVSRVQGIPTADEFWGHIDQDEACSGLGQGLTELARGITLGNTGWVAGQEYTFKFEFSTTSLKVYVNDVLEIDISGVFNDGRLAFYNFSQEQVTYSGYTVIPLAIDIEKSTNGYDADTAPGPSIPIGDPVTWTYVVTNTGDASLTDVVVTDDQGVAISCPQTTLDPGESMTCTAAGIAIAGQYTNLGTVEAKYDNETVSDSDPSNYYGITPVEPPVEVGGHIYHTNKVNLLIPLMAAAVLIATLVTILVWRRRTQS